MRTAALVLALVVVCAGAGAFLAVAFTERGASSHSKRTVYFRGERIAVVDERVRAIGGGHSFVTRRTSLDALDQQTTLEAELDAQGFAISASHTRPGERSVVLSDGGVVVDGVARGPVSAATGPVVLLELAHRLRITDKTDAVLVELSSMESQAVTIERRGPQWAIVDSKGGVVVRAAPEGARVGPGAFAEGDTPPELPAVAVEVPVPQLSSVRGARIRGDTLSASCRGCDGEGRIKDGAYLAAEAFIESDDGDVAAFARPICQPDALSTARLVGEAVAPLVDASAKARAPSARRMLDAGGDCDGAAALAVAALRACGVPARAVVGYRLLDPGTPKARLVPHAIAEVYRAGPGPGRWWRLDPTVRQLSDVDDRFVAVAEGLGGALSMGRVLGVIDAGDVIVDDVASLTPEGAHVDP